jgi:hypothetical protein
MTWFKRKKRCCECRAPEGPFVALLRWGDHNGGRVCEPCAERLGYYEYLVRVSPVTPRS